MYYIKKLSPWAWVKINTAKVFTVNTTLGEIHYTLASVDNLHNSIRNTYSVKNKGGFLVQLSQNYFCLAQSGHKAELKIFFIDVL